MKKILFKEKLHIAFSKAINMCGYLITLIAMVPLVNYLLDNKSIYYYFSTEKLVYPVLYLILIIWILVFPINIILKEKKYIVINGMLFISGFFYVSANNDVAKILTYLGLGNLSLTIRLIICLIIAIVTILLCGYKMYKQIKDNKHDFIKYVHITYLGTFIINLLVLVLICTFSLANINNVLNFDNLLIRVITKSTFVLGYIVGVIHWNRVLFKKAHKSDREKNSSKFVFLWFFGGFIGAEALYYKNRRWFANAQIISFLLLRILFNKSVDNIILQIFMYGLLGVKLCLWFYSLISFYIDSKKYKYPTSKVLKYGVLIFGLSLLVFSVQNSIIVFATNHDANSIKNQYIETLDIKLVNNYDKSSISELFPIENYIKQMLNNEKIIVTKETNSNGFNTEYISIVESKESEFSRDIVEVNYYQIKVESDFSYIQVYTNFSHRYLYDKQKKQLNYYGLIKNSFLENATFDIFNSVGVKKLKITEEYNNDIVNVKKTLGTELLMVAFQSITGLYGQYSAYFSDYESVTYYKEHPTSFFQLNEKLNEKQKGYIDVPTVNEGVNIKINDNKLSSKNAIILDLLLNEGDIENCAYEVIFTFNYPLLQNKSDIQYRQLQYSYSTETK